MPVKNLSKSFKEEKKEEIKKFLIKLNSEEKEFFKSLLNKKEEVRKEVSKNIKIGDSLEMKVELTEYFDDVVIASDLENDWYYGDTFHLEEMLKKKGAPITDQEKILMDIWNSVVEYGDYIHVETIESGKNLVSKELSERSKAILKINNEFRSFFLNLEKKNDMTGLVRAINNLCTEELDDFVHGLKKGHEIEIY